MQASQPDVFPDDPLLTEEDAAKYCGGKSRRFMAQLRMTGTGPKYLKIGGNVRYRKSQLEEYLATCERKSTSAAG